MKRILTYVKTIAIPVITGVIIGLITKNSMNYSDINKPKISPPGIIFPIVWSILYIIMGISYGILKNRKLVDNGVKKIYYLQLAVNSLWPIIFFTLKFRLLAFFWIILLIILVVIMIDKFFFKNKVAGILQIPYLLWLLFALYLNLSIFLLNK